MYRDLRLFEVSMMVSDLSVRDVMDDSYCEMMYKCD